MKAKQERGEGVNDETEGWMLELLELMELQVCVCVGVCVCVSVCVCV